MRLSCYVELDDKRIRVELKGNKVKTATWQTIRDAAVSVFDRGWVNNIVFPKGREIKIEYDRLPKTDEWATCVEQWGNIVEAAGCKLKIIDNAVVDYLSQPEKQAEIIPDGVVMEIQNTFWRQVDTVKAKQLECEKAKKIYDDATKILLGYQVHLSTLAVFLNGQDTDVDWIDEAHKQGVLKR